MLDPEPGTPAWAAEGELIRMLRMCPDCRPADYVLCEAHDAFMRGLYDPCGDPHCPACT